MQNANTADSSARRRHPAGLYNLFFIEMWERFGFYLMLGIFLLYMTDKGTGGLGFDNTKANEIYGWYVALVYLTPFLGGLIADRLLGYRRSVIIGGTLLSLGYAMLAIPGEGILYPALACLVIGNGFFKANISTMVGNLYTADDPLRDAGYGIFYMGINIGAFICNFVAAFMRNKYGWSAAFASASVGMAFGVIIMALSYRKLAKADQRRPQNAGGSGLGALFSLAIGPAIGTGIAGYFLAEQFIGVGQGIKWAFFAALIPIVAFYVGILVKAKKEERPGIAALLSVFACVIVFWMVFQQNGNSLTLFARDDTVRTLPAGVANVLEKIDLYEKAAPRYFSNASADTPRPARTSFKVLSDAEYKKVAESAELLKGFEARKEIPVTQKVMDDAYKKATDTTPSLAPGESLPLASTELFQSINALFIILLSPLVVLFFAGLRRMRAEPSTPTKLFIALVLTASACALMAAAVHATNFGDNKVSHWWLTGTYFILTVAELFLSPIGLSLTSKLAPPHLAGFMMGGWFLATATGNKLAGFMGGLWDQMRHDRLFFLQAGIVAGAALVLLMLLPWLKRVMKGRA